MLKKALLVAFSIIILFAVIFTVFYFARPSVAFISSGLLPSGYELSEPSGSLGYRVTDNAEQADIVIVAPDAAVPQDILSYLFGREAESGENPEGVLAIDNGAMWECAMELGNATLVYEETSSYGRSVADYLKTLYPDIGIVTYTGRITGANIGTVKSEISETGNDIIFLLTPSSSMELIRTDIPWTIVLDERDAAALETTKADYAVSIDWNGTVKSLLDGIADHANA